MSKKGDWQEFSSESESEDDSSDDSSVESVEKGAKGKKPLKSLGNFARAKGAGKMEGKIPRKKKPQPKKSTLGAGANFGADGGHKNAGRKRNKSPKGRQMVLSRRLSRRILKGTPLRSPITAYKLDFASAKKAKGKKGGGATKTKAGGRPPRI